MKHMGKGIVAAVTILLALGFAGPSSAGGAYSWKSTAYDCSKGVVCTVWDAADVPPGTIDGIRALNWGATVGGCTPTATGFSCIERYETAVGGDHSVLAFLHDSRSADGTFNVGGVFWDGPLSMGHAAAAEGTPDLDLPDGLWKVRVNIVDDSGARIGGFFCTDNDGDELCAEASGELAQAVCGSANVFKPMDTASLFRTVVFVDGPTFQTMDCPGSTDVIGGTSGTIELVLTRI